MLNENNSHAKSSITIESVNKKNGAENILNCRKTVDVVDEMFQNLRNRWTLRPKLNGDPVVNKIWEYINNTEEISVLEASLEMKE